MPRSNRKDNKKRPISVTIIVLLAVGEILLRVYWAARSSRPWRA
jgi:hypothetical protein